MFPVTGICNPSLFQPEDAKNRRVDLNFELQDGGKKIRVHGLRFRDKKILQQF